MRQELIWRGVQVIEKMERETWLEPATSSLASCVPIGNRHARRLTIVAQDSILPHTKSTFRQ